MSWAADVRADCDSIALSRSRRGSDKPPSTTPRSFLASPVGARPPRRELALLAPARIGLVARPRRARTMYRRQPLASLLMRPERSGLGETLLHVRACTWDGGRVRASAQERLARVARGA